MKLTTKVSEIIKNVHERMRSRITTHRGYPVALLAPLEAPAQATIWEELVRLGDQIGESWKTDQTSIELFSESRR